MNSIKLKLFVVLTMLSLTIFPFQSFAQEEEKEEDNSAMSDEAYGSLKLFIDVMEMLHKNYVDDSMVSYKKLIDAAMNGMMRELDPYSQYIEPKTFKDFEKNNVGEFGGIGVVLNFDKGHISIVSINQDGPADKAGIRPGDIITEISGESINNKPFDESLELIKGRPDTKVEIKIYRKSDNKYHDFLVVRKIIVVSPVSASKVIEGNIGYICLTQFSKPTTEKMDEALTKLKAQNIKALIFDLRNNPGGYIYSAVDVCSRFLDADKLVVFTKARDNKKLNVHYSKDCEIKMTKIPMVILVNRNSASASEIVSGCLKDYKRAVLVGEKTFGKGSVQSVINLPNNGAVKFTIAKYYTPNEYVIHGKGIEPDINIPLDYRDYMMVSMQLNRTPGEVKPAGENTIEDIQLKRAIEVLKAITIFNGK